MNHIKTNIIGVVVAAILFSKSFNIYQFTPEQETAIQQIAIAILAFFAADGSSVTKSIISRFKNLGK
jgi:hypothetical protein